MILDGSHLLSVRDYSRMNDLPDGPPPNEDEVTQAREGAFPPDPSPPPSRPVDTIGPYRLVSPRRRGRHGRGLARRADAAGPTARSR